MTIALTVDAYKIKATKYADLTWTGGTPAFTIYRNGTAVATKLFGSPYTDTPPKTLVSAIYKVCDASLCSNEVSVTW